MEKSSQKEIAIETPSEDTLEKIVTMPSIKHRKKVTKTVIVSLEVHQTASSLDVSTLNALLLRYGAVTLLIPFVS
jgi:hypothetical protein